MSRVNFLVGTAVELGLLHFGGSDVLSRRVIAVSGWDFEDLVGRAAYS